RPVRTNFGSPRFRSKITAQEKDATMTQRFPTEAMIHELPEPGEWLKLYGDALYRYALARLRQHQEAEDAVQETLLAALKARQQFQRRSHPRTWLIGILQRKVLDRLRTAVREGSKAEGNDLSSWFDARGKWSQPPGQPGSFRHFIERRPIMN